MKHLLKLVLVLCSVMLCISCQAQKLQDYPADTSPGDNDNVLGYMSPGGSGTTRRFPLVNLKTYFQNGTGTLNSVGLTMPSIFTVSNSPLSGNGGTFAVTYSGTPMPIIYGGTGTSTPGLVNGTGISVGGSWPNQTITNTAITSYVRYDAAQGLTLAQQTQALSNVGILTDFKYATPQSFKKYRLAIANTRQGVSDTIINIVGDSTAAGVVLNNYANARVHSFPFKLVQEFNNIGQTIISDGWFGDALSSTHSSSLQSYYPQVVQNSGWASNSGVTIIAGYPQNNTTTTTNLATTSLLAADTAVVYYVTNTGLGSFTTQVDSGTVSGSIATAGAAGISAQVVSLGSSAVHTLNIARVSGSVFIAGVEFYSASIHKIRVRNFGWGGAKTSDWATTTNAWSPLTQLATANFAANLTIISLGINDWLNSVTPATAVANITSIVNAAKTNGSDVLIIQPFPSNTASASGAVQLAMTQAIDAYAQANSIPLLDWNHRVTSWSQAVSDNFASASDSVHPLEVGYTDLSIYIRECMQSVAQ